jgi:diguanylate cyclase (GGDEF)-like protein
MAIVLAIAALALAACLVVFLRLRSRLQATERDLELYRIAVESLPNGGVVLFDQALRVRLAGGPALVAFRAGSSDPDSARRLGELLPADDCAIVEPACRAALEGRPSVLQLPLGGRDFAVHVVPVRAGRRITGGLLAVHDVTRGKSNERRLTELASRDPLTGLWNRARLSHEVSRLLDRAALSDGRRSSLLMLDLDGFKGVNDRLGHEAGDELLRRAARAIESAVRKSDVVARLGGDEFAVVLADADGGAAAHAAEAISRAIEGVWPLGLPGGVSAGTAPIGEGCWTVAEVLARADRAMYADKSGARLRVA